MKRMHGTRLLTLPAAVVLASCASAPSESPRPVSPSPGFVLQPAPYQSFEAAQRDKALALTAQDRWGDAAIEWEILTLLRPDNVEYRTRLQDAKARIAKGVEEYLRSAQDARQRGDAQQAALLYLKTLKLDPTNPTAIEALRALDQEAQRRKLHTRVARMAVSKDASPARNVANVEHRDLEFGVLLFHQGEYADSIKTLERYVKTAPKDELGRRYLSDAHFQLAQQRMEQGKTEEALSNLESAKGTHEQEPNELKAKIDSVRKSIAEDYYQKGMKVYRTNLDEAISYWERSLQYDPSHPQAGVRLQQARQMQKNLKAIDGNSGQP